jgi:hypothetical protein
MIYPMAVGAQDLALLHFFFYRFKVAVAKQLVYFSVRLISNDVMEVQRSGVILPTFFAR